MLTKKYSYIPLPVLVHSLQRAQNRFITKLITTKALKQKYPQPKNSKLQNILNQEIYLQAVWPKIRFNI